MDLHWPELVMLGGLLCMAQFAAVRGLFKQESSRAVSLWSRSGMLLGIALLLWGLSVHLPPDIAVAGAMVLALIGLLGLMGLILAVIGPSKCCRRLRCFQSAQHWLGGLPHWRAWPTGVVRSRQGQTTRCGCC